MQQILNAVVFGWFGVIAEQLTTHHFSAEVRELDAKREKQFHAPAS